MDNKVFPETEKRLDSSMQLHKMNIADVVSLMIEEEYNVINALKKCQRNIENVIAEIVKSFQQNGRLFYVGAGTSGRLGVLDASECPPTFSVTVDMVQGIMAGGNKALYSAVEGAEDREDEGAKQIISRQIVARDIVIGIAASGGTPFVHGALKKAKERQAKTVLITCSTINTQNINYIDHIISAIVGPEILSGSTRLKAGTVTKLILNMLSTISMIQIGKTYQNLMVDVNPSNEKLVKRVIRIFGDITGNKNEDFAHSILTKTNYDLKTAIVMTLKNVDFSTAKKILRDNQAILYKALEHDDNKTSIDENEHYA